MKLMLLLLKLSVDFTSLDHKHVDLSNLLLLELRIWNLYLYNLFYLLIVLVMSFYLQHNSYDPFSKCLWQPFSYDITI